MTLKFFAGNHSYVLDGKKIPGVTTLLNKGLPKPALPYWSARSVAEFVADNPEGVESLRAMGRGPMVQALKGVPWEKRDVAAVRGTDVHALAERVIHGEGVDVPEHLVGHVQGYAHWLDEFGVEPILTEQTVASRRWFYAGRFDAIVRFTHGPWAGRVVLADWKTSSGVYGEVAIQCAAYSSAEFFAPEPAVESPLPEIEATGVVHITENGSQFYPLAQDAAEIAEHFKIFTHIAYLAKKTDYIKELIGSPMSAEEMAS